MSLHVVPWYAAGLALLFVALSVRVIRTRRSERVAIGVAQNALLERRVRVHANFAEYVPFALLLLAMAELRGANTIALNLLGILLVAGRLLHAWGVSRPQEDFRFRVAGMASTFGTLAGAALLIVAGGV